jgi:hypothetical protein
VCAAWVCAAWVCAAWVCAAWVVVCGCCDARFAVSGAWHHVYVLGGTYMQVGVAKCCWKEHSVLMVILA